MKRLSIVTALLAVFLCLGSGCAAVSQATGQIAETTGVQLPDSYCDLPSATRCALEAKIEDQVNAGIDQVGDSAVVDVNVVCPPTFTSDCKAPDFDTGAEAGDYKRVRATVSGDP